MSYVRRLLSARPAALICALGSSALLLTACGNAETTRADVAAAAPTSPSASGMSASGSSTASPSSSSPSAGESSMTEDRAERKALVPQAKVTWDKAADTAVKEVPKGKLTELELQRVPDESPSASGTASPSTPNPAPSSGAPEWAAKVAAPDGTVHDIDIDAVTGKVFRSQLADQDADDKREIADRLGKARQTPQQAVKTATGKTKGTVTSVELDENDDKRLVWSVDIVDTGNWNKTTYDIDAAKGDVVREHTDRD
ncbi:PepSY domain-containing protein [Streptomyces sp. NPDC005876]|uniref:PepSY domain-containing protein n=1 Tax=unclassified Streptomyces TaxID=2593676 RepID=UPI0033E03C59